MEASRSRVDFLTCIVVMPSIVTIVADGGYICVSGVWFVEEEGEKSTLGGNLNC